jgi:hypothetical protein
MAQEFSGRPLIAETRFRSRFVVYILKFRQGFLRVIPLSPISVILVIPSFSCCSYESDNFAVLKLTRLNRNFVILL